MRDGKGVDTNIDMELYVNIWTWEGGGGGNIERQWENERNYLTKYHRNDILYSLVSAVFWRKCIRMG